jgi:pimeloyl-ACP methyl ester carboxylesterase
MNTALIPGVLFIFINIPYWYLQLMTGFFSRRYFAQVGFLLLGALAGLSFIISLRLQNSALNIYWIMLGVFVGFLSLIMLIIAIIKLFINPNDRPRDLHSISRSQTLFNSAIKRLKLRTEDGIFIQVLHLVGERPRKNAIVVCHGGGRNKDIHANVITCELLFETYDVLTFDFRGHQESGGKWMGDGNNKYDLKAVIDYARSLGYEKIGVVGWSFGAWTAVIEAAEFRNVDSLVAAAPPPTDFREVEMTKVLFSWGYKPWALPIRILVTIFRGVRIGKYDQHPSLLDYVDQVSPTPMLIVCNEYDRTIGMPEDRFREIFTRAREPKKFVVLKGSGHIYDWPNTFHYLNFVKNWLAETIG